MAPPDATNREPAPPDQPVHRQGLLGVRGTGRVEPAVRPQKRRHKAPIYPNELNQSSRHNLAHPHTDPPVDLAGSGASGVGAASTPSDCRQLSKWPVSSANAAPTAVFRTTTTQSTGAVLGRSSRHATRIWRFKRFRSTAVPTARETTRPSRACPGPSRRPKGAPPSPSHTCTTKPPAPRLRPSRSTRRNSRGAVSLSRDSRRCRSPRPTPRDVPALCAGAARSLPGPPVSASGSGIRGSSCGGVCLAEKFASRITSRFSRRDRPKPQVNVSASRLAFRPGYLL